MHTYDLTNSVRSQTRCYAEAANKAAEEAFEARGMLLAKIDRYKNTIDLVIQAAKIPAEVSSRACTDSRLTSVPSAQSGFQGRFRWNRALVEGDPFRRNLVRTTEIYRIP
jgi:hypothetical protein